MKNAEIIDGALVPALTAWDLKILRAVPAAISNEQLLSEPPGIHGVSAWRVAEAARELNVTAVLSTLRGLYDRGLVHPLGFDTQRKAQRWMRTGDGDRKAAA